MNPIENQTGAENRLAVFHASEEGAALRRSVLYFARRNYVPDPESDAEDAISHANLCYLRDPHRAEVVSLNAWLFTRARNYLIDVLREKERHKRLERKAADTAKDVAQCNDVKQSLEEQELREKARCLIKDYLNELTDSKAVECLRWWLYGEPSAQEITERYGISRPALNHHVDKLLLEAATRFGTLAEYRAARKRRRPKGRGKKKQDEQRRREELQTGGLNAAA